MKPRNEIVALFFAGVLLWTVGSMADPKQAIAKDAIPAQVKTIVESKTCLTCHTIGNLAGGQLAPNLRYVGERRSKTWIAKWLKDPPSMKTPTIMPPGLLNQEEIELMSTYLASLKNPMNARAILKKHKNDTKAAGKALFVAHDCGTCHKVDGQGGNLSNTGPDLKGTSTRRKPDWLRAWLKNPQKVKKGTFMPTFKLSEAEVEALTAYLSSL